MGEGYSKYPMLSKKDPKYKKLFEVFKSYNKDYQKLLDEFLTEQEKSYAEIRDFKIENEKLRKNNNQLQQTIRSLEQNTVSKPNDKKFISECLDQQTKLETQVKDLLKQQEILKQEIDKHKRETQILPSEKECALSREAQCPIGAATWSSVKEKELCSLREETKTIKQTMMTLLQGENQKEEENSKLKEKTDQLERNFLKKANEFDKLTFEMQECREKFKVNESKLKKKTDQLERNYFKKANEFDKLTFKMQECREKFKENERLTDIQPPEGSNDNTSLGSDRYRPIKLAEEWSSLYTDEWSEAFDELFKIKKTNDNLRIEKELSDIIHKCYSTCVKIGEKQMVDIKKHTWDIACCLHHRPDQLVEAAQTTMFNKMVNDEKVDKKAATTVLSHRNNGGDVARLVVIQKCMEELVDIVHERRKYDKKLLDYVKQETLRQFEHYRKPGSTNHVIKFVERCTDLCWSMVIKSPSMILVYDQPEGGPIDKNMFTVYTKQGPIIDFVVWPALILHTDGPILAKGAAQGKELEPNGYKGTKINSESKGNSTLTTTKTAISTKGETETNRVNWKNVKL